MASLMIATYSGRSTWEFLESSRNAADSSVSARISHLSAYAMLGKVAVQPPPPPPPAPARFSVTDATLSASTVRIGETITVSTRVSNTGGSGGTYEVVFRVNGTVEATRTVSLPAGSDAAVVFNTTRSAAGTYSFDVNGNAGSFTVQAPPPPSAPPPALETQAAAEAPGRSTTASVVLIAGIAGAALVICGGILIVRRLRRQV
jgi:hypothetical protein